MWRIPNIRPKTSCLTSKGLIFFTLKDILEVTLTLLSLFNTWETRTESVFKTMNSSTEQANFLLPFNPCLSADSSTANCFYPGVTLTQRKSIRGRYTYLRRLLRLNHLPGSTIEEELPTYKIMWKYFLWSLNSKINSLLILSHKLEIINLLFCYVY